MKLAHLQKLAAAVMTLAVIGAAAVTPTDSEAAKSSSHAPRNKVKFDKGSGETAKERDRRMTRECRGRPNAGACLGFGQ